MSNDICKETNCTKDGNGAEDILRYAEKSGCDWDGDIIQYNGKRYYVDIRLFGIPEKNIWRQMIQLLPSSYNQTRNVMMNCETLANIYKSRKRHKLDEWIELCKWIETLPYSKLITRKEED